MDKSGIEPWTLTFRISYFVPRDEKERFSVQPFFFSKILSRDAFLLEGKAREQKSNPEIIFEKKNGWAEKK